MVNGSASISSARLRLQGYQEGLKLADLKYDGRYVYETSFGPVKDLSDMERWIEGMEPPPTAIVAGNNVLAVEVMKLLRTRGLSIPEDISIVCFDDLGPYSETEPFLTVAAQQAYQFGYIGMQMLIERIQERSDSELPWKKIVLPAELIIRRSVRGLS
ncbi:HTH-type transcriptional repressor CytR [compost metagenome]